MYTHIAIDCSSLIYSNAHAMGNLKANEMETGAIFGFLRNLLYLSQNFHCNNFIFCWDSRGSDRKDIFPDYKHKRSKNRKDDPEKEALFQSVFRQSDQLKDDIIPRMGFKNSFAQDGKEADDILAILVLHYSNILMVSNDEDMFQMLDLCDLWNNSKKKLWSERGFIKEYGIKAPVWAEVKAIGGCKSDEVPGVPGVAEKTAIKYILGKLGRHTKAYAGIEGSAELIKRNRELVTLPMDGTSICSLRKNELDYHEWLKICKEYWLQSFLDHHDIDWENFFRGRV